MLLKQTPSQFQEEYYSRLELPRYQDYPNLSFFGVAYDAMWAMAVGLHNAAIRIAAHNDSGCDNKPGEIKPLEEFDYFNQKMGCIFKLAFQDIHFPGITVSSYSYTIVCMLRIHLTVLF